MSRRLGREWVGVGVGKVRLDTLVKEPVEGRRVRDISGICLASTAGEDAADTSLAVKDDGAGIAMGREYVGLVVRKDCPLHRRPVRAVLEVFAHKGHDAGSAANSHAGVQPLLMTRRHGSLFASSICGWRSSCSPIMP